MPLFFFYVFSYIFGAYDANIGASYGGVTSLRISGSTLKLSNHTVEKLYHNAIAEGNWAHITVRNAQDHYNVHA